MNPALSVVLFTTLSGAGLGLLMLLGFAQLLAPLPLSREFAVLPLITGVILIALGLGASFGHLGRPERAWRAFSQWRTSWLSREAVAASATLAAAAINATLVWNGALGFGFQVASLVLALLALLTLFTTARIYTSLPTIRAWANGFVWPVMLLAGVVCGAGLLWCLLALAMWELPASAAVALAMTAVTLGSLKLAYWRFLDRTDHGLGAGRATGLEGLGRVRPAEAPHTEVNYLLREMAYVVARRHARRLRVIALVAVSGVPAACALSTAALRGGDLSLGALATTCALFGAFVERWLFLAEARHVVVGYYR